MVLLVFVFEMHWVYNFGAWRHDVMFFALTFSAFDMTFCVLEALNGQIWGKTPRNVMTPSMTHWRFAILTRHLLVFVFEKLWTIYFLAKRKKGHDAKHDALTFRASYMKFYLYLCIKSSGRTSFGQNVKKVMKPSMTHLRFGHFTWRFACICV